MRRRRKRKCDGSTQSETACQDAWSIEEDLQLLETIWSGARGNSLFLPGRSYEMCKKRLQRIRKHVASHILELHKHAPPEAIRVVTDILHDTQYLDAVDDARSRLSKPDLPDLPDLPDVPAPPDDMYSDVKCAKCETESDRNASDVLMILDSCTNMMRDPVRYAAESLGTCTQLCIQLQSTSAVDPTTAKNDCAVLHTIACDAEDTWVQNGRAVTQEVLRSRADANLSGHPRRLEVCVGQSVLLTMNRRRQHADYANGTLSISRSISTVSSRADISFEPLVGLGLINITRVSLRWARVR